MKRLTVDQRIKYAKMILAHLHYDKEETVRIARQEWGVITKHMKPFSLTGYNHRIRWSISRMSTSCQVD